LSFSVWATTGQSVDRDQPSLITAAALDISHHIGADVQIVWKQIGPISVPIGQRGDLRT
jgi:hypothetical protein